MTQKVVVAVLFIFGVRWIAHRLRRYRGPSAPSPPSDPLLGHLLRLPKKDLDLYLHELRSIYGDVFNIRIPGSNFLVLNSVKPAVDLLEGRSGIYNDRPSAPLAQLCEVGDTMFFMRPNEEFRLHRRVFNNYLSKSKLVAQGPEIFSLTQHHVLNAIRTIMTCKPEDIHDHFLVFATAVITELTFGHRLSRQPEDDPYFKLAYDVNFHGIPAVKPHGSEIIDVFPILTKLPDWLPINKHVVNAKRAGLLFKRFTSFPYEDVQKKMEERNASPCILVSELEKLQDGSSTATPHQLQQIMTSFFLGGAGAVATTVSIMAAAFILYPETQARAQEEIERVVGSNRLPELSDRASLPYIEGVLEEVLRWKPSAPLGIPHLASEDDIYNGYSIPKGTIILSNITAMSLDESVYQDPTRFDPSRFLPQPEGRGEPIFHSAFGFGRRVCPGRYFATDTLWVAMATLISALTISRPLDSAGKEYTPEIEWEVHQTCHPSHFPCRITPRNPKILSTLESLAISDDGI